jgi:hypothetical protein
MKAIQITIDEARLERLDAEPEVRRDGRSAVLRRAVAAHLRRKRCEAIAEAYERAHGRGDRDSELEGWEREGAWPDE